MDRLINLLIIQFSAYIQKKDGLFFFHIKTFLFTMVKVSLVHALV